MTGRPSSLLFRNAQLLGQGSRDVRIVGRTIAAVGSHIDIAAGERVIDAGGNLLIPGLHDHHLHLFATAASRDSVKCGPPEIVDETALAEVLQMRCQRGSGMLRGTGFHESVCADLDRHWLDRVCPQRPLKIQHRSGMLWILNSAALGTLKLARHESLPAGVERDANGQMTGRFYDLDEWLGERLQREWPSLAGLSAEFARYGVTGVTDTGVNNGIEVWRALEGAIDRGEWAQRVLLMGSEQLNDIKVSDVDRLSVGPLKIYLRDAELPDFDRLVERIRRAHEQHRAVAVHCVTLVELHYVLAAIAMAGSLPGDRIEHASVCDDEAIARMKALGITVVTQPHFIAERGDQYLLDVDAVDIPLLYRGAGLLSEGVILAAGSDAPYGSIDPWASMDAAVQRRTATGNSMRSDECLIPEQSIGLFGENQKSPTGQLRNIAAGQAADLCLLDVCWETLREHFSAEHVAMTLCDGYMVFER